MTHRTLLSVAAFAAGLYLMAVLALFVMQRGMVFRPGTLRPTAPSGFQAVQITAEDGTPLLAWERPGPTGGPVMLYLHGNGGTLDNRATRATSFARLGVGLLFLEWRGYGGNTGAPSEAGFMSDAHGAMAHLAKQGIGPERVVLYGESIGSGIAVRIAAERQVAALVLESPYTSLRAIAQAQMWWAPVGLLMRDPIDALAAMPSVTAPVLMLQGARDDVVPPAMGRAMFDAAREPKRLWTADRGGHGDLMAFGLQEQLAAFLSEQVIRGGIPRRSME